MRCCWRCQNKHPSFGVSWWRHQMETFPAQLAICAGNSPHKGQWRGALKLSLICVWINDWVNNHDAGDLRRYRVHYDVIVMWTYIDSTPWGRVTNADYFDGLEQERRNSMANALQLRLSCTKPSICQLGYRINIYRTVHLNRNISFKRCTRHIQLHPHAYAQLFYQFLTLSRSFSTHAFMPGAKQLAHEIELWELFQDPTRPVTARLCKVS